jgi:hypothetical protein
MLGESTVRRPGFRIGTWIRLADDQEWSFPDPPAPGVDVQYDALKEALFEAENRDEVLQIELAISILLLSRNYDLKPADFERILDFGDDRIRLRAVQSAVSSAIAARGSGKVGRPTPDAAEPRKKPRASHGQPSLLSTWAIRVKVVLSLLLPPTKWDRSG